MESFGFYTFHILNLDTHNFMMSKSAASLLGKKKVIVLVIS